MYLNYQLIY